MSLALSVACRFNKMLEILLLTVLVLIPSFSAISALLRPWVKSSKMLRSRCVNSSKACLGAGGRGRGEILHHALGNARAKNRTAIGNRLNSAVEFSLVGVFKQIASRAGTNGREHRGVIFKHRDD
jgi:hypothetical protein